MNKTVINVPAGIRYISEWNGFKLPEYPHIIDKKIPGCGFTEWVLTNNIDSILACPRKMLLENKYEQHTNDVFLVTNDYEQTLRIDKNLVYVNKKQSMPSFLTQQPKQIITQQQPIVDEVAKKKYYNNLSIEIMNYVNFRRSNGLPVKILVTYDSFYLIYNILNNSNIMSEFQIVVDEFQSVFVDSRFKSTTEMTFSSYLRLCNKVCYVSATPMIESYLDKLSEFRTLPYFEFDWNALQPDRVMKPDLEIKINRSVTETARGIVEKYKSKDFDYATSNQNTLVYSKEAVIYVNSVRNILSIIKNSNLLPDDVNILCARTKENEKKLINKLGKNYKIGRVPLYGEPHKMITLCTRTVYLGADFYSDNAKTFIISDANINTLAVDISLDLPQILGRQRLDSNPWKNKAVFYYKPLSDKNVVTEKEFEDNIKLKIKYTNDVLASHRCCPVENLDGIMAVAIEMATNGNYRINYVAVDNIYDSLGNVVGKKVVPNELVMIAEQRAYDIQQIDYKDRFTVFNNVNKVSSKSNMNSSCNLEAATFFKQYDNYTSYYDKLKYLCTYQFSSDTSLDIVLDNIGEKHFKEYYRVLGPSRCKSLGYDITKIGKEINMLLFNPAVIRDAIYSNFSEGKRYTRAYIKDTLDKIYYDIGYKKKAKACDIEEWFVTKNCLINSGKQRTNSYELIQKKQC